MLIFNITYKKKSYLYAQEKNIYKYNLIIDYNSIISKIIKKDKLKSKPNKEIVSLEIYSILKKLFQKKIVNDFNVLYILKNYDDNTKNSINNVLLNLSVIYKKSIDIKYFDND